MATPISFDRLASRAAFETEPPEHLYHYTDLEGVEGILLSKSLWMSKFTASNDISEITLAISQFQNFVESRVAALEADEASFLHEAAAQLDSFRRTNICLASFCEQPDLLSQWRSYGIDGRGIALGFDTRVLQDLARRYSLRLWKCVYDPALHVKISNDLLTMLLESFRAARPKSAEERRDIIGQFHSTFLRVAPVIKDHRFAEESEWRLISSPIGFDHPRMIAVFAANHASVKMDLPLSAEAREITNVLSRVVIGPTPLDPQNVADAIAVLSRRNGFRIGDIGFSGIPYRRTDL
jgi:hypothetical protein